MELTKILSSLLRYFELVVKFNTLLHVFHRTQTIPSNHPLNFSIRPFRVAIFVTIPCPILHSAIAAATILNGLKLVNSQTKHYLWTANVCTRKKSPSSHKKAPFERDDPKVAKDPTEQLGRTEKT